MMKKLTLTLLALCMLGAFLASCSPSPDAGATTGGTTTTGGEKDATKTGG